MVARAILWKLETSVAAKYDKLSICTGESFIDARGSLVQGLYLIDQG